MPSLKPWKANMDFESKFGILWLVLFCFGMIGMALYSVSVGRNSQVKPAACEIDARLYETADSIAITQLCAIESEIKQDMETMRNSACSERYTPGLCDSIISYIDERAQRRRSDIELFKLNASRRNK